MPRERYDKLFGGETGSAEKAYRAMRKEYGIKKGREVFYATVAKRRERKAEEARA